MRDLISLLSMERVFQPQALVFDLFCSWGCSPKPRRSNNNSKSFLMKGEVI